MSASSDETIPQIALFIQESAVRPPPPPPHATSNSTTRTSARNRSPMIVPMQHLPPPPPPPLPAVPSTSTSQLHNTIYRAQSPRPSTSYAICHPPRGFAEFDATRPPPPIPNHAQYVRMSDSCSAGPSKLRRTEQPKCDEAMCDACVQREISIEKYRTQMEKISSEDECQTLLLKKMQNDYLKQKDLLRSLVGSDLFRKIEEFVEDVPQYNFQSVLNNLNDSFRTGLTSSIPNQMLLQFMEYFFSDSSKFESLQSARAEVSLRQTLSAISRSPIRRSSPDLLQTLQDMLYNQEKTSSSERPDFGELSVERAHNASANGVSSYHRYSNGQHVEPRLAPRLEHRAPPPPPPPPAPLPPPAPRLTASEPTPPAPLTYPHHPHHPHQPHYPHYPPPRAHYPPRHLPEPTPSTSRAPMQPYPPRHLPEPTPSTSRAPVQPYPPYTPERHPSHYYYHP